MTMKQNLPYSKSNTLTHNQPLQIAQKIYKKPKLSIPPHQIKKQCKKKPYLDHLACIDAIKKKVKKKKTNSFNPTFTLQTSSSHSPQT